tara:strand:+ start:5318 stop:5533 length:216 start_codon:yes stop_codon:yes gene_type:complete
MAEQERVKFTIKQDGTVIEEVLNAEGNKCVELTKTIEERLGDVVNRDYKSEYYQQNTVEENVPLQHHQDDN